jgi:exopolyphosphatase/guanosine-5'-triphosphate,3'-diphosphate pyrophosphatase
MKANKKYTVAVIDIGSHSISMMIGEVEKKGIKILEDVKGFTQIGRDVFNYGHIKYDSIINVIETLLKFKKLMREYGVNQSIAVATSALREADNREYVLNQIELRTGMIIEVLHNSKERWLTYKGIREAIPFYHQLREEGVLITDLGAGSMEVSLYAKDMHISTYNLRLGALRIKEVLADLERKTVNFSNVVEQYLASALDQLQAFIPLKQINHFMCFSGETYPILMLLQRHDIKEPYIILTKEEILEIYRKLTKTQAQTLAQELNIHAFQAELLLPTVIVFKYLMTMVGVDKIIIPFISLRNGLLCDYYDQKFGGSRAEVFEQDILSAAISLGSRYLFDEKHALAVERFSVQMFDKLKKIHGLGKRERLLLQLAAILHDIGKFINFRQHHIHSYNIIRYSDILGLKANELKLIANIARYHTKELPNVNQPEYKELTVEERVIVSKLAAIIRLADALDQSHLQRINKLTIKNQEQNLFIEVPNQDILLEQWMFNQEALFFAEVFGAYPHLKAEGVKHEE